MDKDSRKMGVYFTPGVDRFFLCKGGITHLTLGTKTHLDHLSKY